MTLIVATVLASLVGSPHCAAMCGPFTCLYASGSGGSRLGIPHLAYNLGRLAAYLLLGVVAGALGSGIDGLGQIAGIGRLAGWIAGAAMVVWAVVTIAGALGARVPLAPVPAALRKLFSRSVSRWDDKPPEWRAAALGLTTTLLPCGWLYAFVAVAASTGSVGGGVAVMTAFWIGTLPIMIGLGVGAAKLIGPFRRKLPLATGTILLILGLLAMAGRLSVELPLPNSDVHQHR